ncbi:UNVERIFIED_ORG: hypothetical protein BDU10_3110 [Burkholderia sp. CF145]
MKGPLALWDQGLLASRSSALRHHQNDMCGHAGLTRWPWREFSALECGTESQRRTVKSLHHSVVASKVQKICKHCAGRLYICRIVPSANLRFCELKDRDVNLYNGRRLSQLAICVSLLGVANAQARGPLLAEQTAAQWGGPEFRLRCVSEASMTGFKCEGLKCRRNTWKTCKGSAVDYKQHRLTARMYGPDNIGNVNQQLRDISRACLASGLIIAGVPALVTAPAGDISVEIIKTGVEACLKTTSFLSQVAAPGFEVTIDATESWD